jgi:hypothetical protein
MKVWDSLRRIFGAKDAAAPRELRNKPNCMAWVKLGADRWNAQQLDGRAVKCVSVDPQGYWLVEPPQEMCVGSFAMAVDGQLVWPGEVATVTNIHDKYLEPWKDLVDEACDETLWMVPWQPQSEILALPVREMK